jgi:hypothetical protein
VTREIERRRREDCWVKPHCALALAEGDKIRNEDKNKNYMFLPVFAVKNAIEALNYHFWEKVHAVTRDKIDDTILKELKDFL